MTTQELEEHIQRFGLEDEAIARVIQSNAMNNPPRAVDEIIHSHRQPIAPRDRPQPPAHMMYEEDDLYLDETGAI